MILVVWGGLPAVGVVIGAEVFLCITESVFEAGQSLSVRNVVTTIEREMVLAKS
ncbi:hypothetical protein ES704_04049 [subsurface metagenome]